MILNQQNEIRIDLAATRKFVGHLRKCLRLGRHDFNVCFVADKDITTLNATYRGKARPTDVLSFQWTLESGDQPEKLWQVSRRNSGRAKSKLRKAGKVLGTVDAHEFENFLGDVVISVETARRNARVEGHSVAREVRWLILHGALHLLGYDHESDGGVMTDIEQEIRTRMKI